jgi:hypothetical protein
VITKGDEAALTCLVDDLAARFGTLPAVLGPEPEVTQFAQLWAQRVGSVVRPGMKHRRFEIREVRPLPCLTHRRHFDAKDMRRHVWQR